MGFIFILHRNDQFVYYLRVKEQRRDAGQGDNDTMKAWKYLYIIAVLCFTLMVSGCNTFKGMGKDVEGAGKAIQKGADKTKDAIAK